MAYKEMLNLLTKSLTVTLVIVLVANCVSSQRRKRTAKAPAALWYLFTSPDQEFTLRFPQKPNQEENAPGPITLIRSYEAVTKSGMRFGINFQDVGGDPRSRENNEWAKYLEQMSTDAARDRGERVVQIHRLAKNVVETELWQTVPATGDNINYLSRSILRRGRIYTLGCGSLINNAIVNKAICREFFNSLRFTQPRVKRRSHTKQ